MIRQTPRILKSGKHDPAFYEKLWKTISEGRVWKGRLTNRKKDGTLYEEDATISPIRNQDGVITNFVGVKRDITREVALENQLIQSQKMESIGTLAGGIAHDFNNILAAIIGYTEIGLLESEDEQTVNHLKEVLRAGERAKALVNQILTFSRRSEVRLQPLIISSIVEETLKLLRASLPSTIEIRQDIVSDAAVMADPTQIHQVIMNLCTNAAQSMVMDGGVLKVSLEDTFDFPRRVSTGEKNFPFGWLKLSVQDNGCGIPPEIMDRIFDPFFTTKEKESGTGMGLAVVHGIIASIGGDINVRSEPGKGTVFDIFLPKADIDDIQIENMDDAIATSGNERILIVDDEESIIDVVRRLLERLGYRTTACMRSEEALQIFKADPKAFDLVITDMTMPKMTGDQLANELLKVRPDIPIILCTGYSERITEEEARKIGIKAFAIKPLSVKDLSITIRNVLDMNIS